MDEHVANSPHPVARRTAVGVLVGSIVLYIVLVLPMVFRHAISWDEQTDISVASSYPNDVWGWVVGSGLDAANVRLPMYLAGLVFGVTGEPSLLVARLISCLFGILTILGVYVFCRRELDRSKAAAAALIVASSPYFLPFSKVAFTEGDIFVTCGLVWTLVAAARFLRIRTLGRCVALGIVLGLTLSAKISAVAIIAPVLLYILISGMANRREAGTREAAPGAAAAAWAAAICGWIAAGMAFGVTRDWPRYDPDRIAFLLGHYAAALAAWSLLLVWAIRSRSRPVGGLGGVFAVGAIAAATFFVVPPVHMTNPRVAAALWDAFTLGNTEFSWAMVREAALLHAAVITLKPSLAVGAFLWIGFLAAALRWRSRPELRLPVLVCVFYVPFLVRMPWAQTFHMMPLFPVLAIFAADAWVDAYRRWKIPAAAVAALAAGFLVYDFAVAYPDLQLNGYQWTGARFWGGRATLAPRGIAQLTPDGLQQCLGWIDANVSSHDTAVSYIGHLSTRHIVNGTFSDPRFLWIEGEQVEDGLDLADYVLVSLGGAVREGHGLWNPTGKVVQPRYDEAKLSTEFEKVFAVRRRFELEVASVWRRKSKGAPQAFRTPDAPPSTVFGPLPIARPIIRSTAHAAHRRDTWAEGIEGVQLRPGKTVRRTIEGCNGRSLITFAASAETAGAVLFISVPDRRTRHRLESDETILVPFTMSEDRSTISFRLANQGPGGVMVTWTLDPAEALRWAASQADPNPRVPDGTRTGIESAWCLVREHRLGRLEAASGAPDSCGSQWIALVDAFRAVDADEVAADRQPMGEVAATRELLGIEAWAEGDVPPVRMEAECVNALGASAVADDGPAGVRCALWDVPERGTHGPDRTILRLGTVWCPAGRYRATCRLRIRAPADAGRVAFCVRAPRLLASADLERPTADAPWQDIVLPFTVPGLAPIRFELQAETGAQLLVDRVDLRADVPQDAMGSLAQMLLAAAALENDNDQRIDLVTKALALAPDQATGPGALARAAAAIGAFTKAADAARASAAARPGDPANLEEAARILRAAGYVDEAADLEQRSRSLIPAVPLDVGFSAGVRLIGWDPPSMPLKPGDRFPLTWYWTADRDIRSDWAVYVHFLQEGFGEGYRFQDDHVPTDAARAGSSAWLPGSIVREQRSVLIPPEAPLATYHVRIGLVFPPLCIIEARPAYVDLGEIAVGGIEAD